MNNNGLGRVGCAETGPRPSGQAPAGLDASRFDPARFDITLCGGVAYVLPRYEGRVRWAKRIGSFGIGVSWRWTSFNVGIDWLKAGGLIAIGPFYVWLAHIEKMGAEIERWDRDSDASLAEDAATRLSPEGVAARPEGIAQPPTKEPTP